MHFTMYVFSVAQSQSIWHSLPSPVTSLFWYKNRLLLRLLRKTNEARYERTYDVLPSCGRQEYPVLMPAVIVGITNGDRIICSKYEGRSFKQYALIAGFAEIGETIEQPFTGKLWKKSV